jgi:hypothetical protein
VPKKVSSRSCKHRLGEQVSEEALSHFQEILKRKGIDGQDSQGRVAKSRQLLDLEEIHTG